MGAVKAPAGRDGEPLCSLFSRPSRSLCLCLCVQRSSSCPARVSAGLTAQHPCLPAPGQPQSAAGAPGMASPGPGSTKEVLGGGAGCALACTALPLLPDMLPMPALAWGPFLAATAALQPPGLSSCRTSAHPWDGCLPLMFAGLPGVPTTCSFASAKSLGGDAWPPALPPLAWGIPSHGCQKDPLHSPPPPMKNSL